VSDAIPYRLECTECGQLQRAEHSAHAAFDRSAETDARVLARRHLNEAHSESAVTR
jgi:hypothetical protein